MSAPAISALAIFALAISDLGSGPSDRRIQSHRPCSRDVTRRRLTRRAFTLVEILIVVIILGILAAIVIPQFANATQNARISSLQSQLQMLRSQVQLYKIQHGDNLPNLVASWAPLTQGSTYGTSTYVPYILAVPTNSLNGFSTVSDATASLSGLTSPAALTALMKTTTGIGFLYDYQSGNGSGLIYATDGTGSAVAGGGTAY